MGPLGWVGQQVFMEHLRQDKRRAEPNLLALFLAQLRDPLPEAGAEPCGLREISHCHSVDKAPGNPLPAYPQLAGPMMELLAL